MSQVQRFRHKKCPEATYNASGQGSTARRQIAYIYPTYMLKRIDILCVPFHSLVWR